MLAIALVGSLAKAQSPLAPDLSLHIDGFVYAIARQPDGGIVIAGNFARVGNYDRINIARLRPDGSLDVDWGATANGVVWTLAVGADGAIYLGGDFYGVNGELRYGVAKLSAQGVLDAGWNPGVSGSVSTLVMDSAGALYVGGYFSQVGGLPRQSLAKLSSAGTGAVDAAWNPTVDGSVMALALASDGGLIASGFFKAVSGQSRAGMVKLSALGSVDANWNPVPNNPPYVLASDGNGAVFAAGFFNTISGHPRLNIAKLSDSGTGAVDLNWNPGINGSVLSLALGGDGALYAGGVFSNVGGLQRRRAVKLSVAGPAVVDATWAPMVNDGFVQALQADASGMVRLGGTFKFVNSQMRIGLAAVAADSALQPALNLRKRGGVKALARDSAGGLLVGGEFNTVGSLFRNNLLRVQPDGTLDTTWNPNPDGPVHSIATDAASNAYVSGQFGQIGGQYRAWIAKVSTTGTGAADALWHPVANGYAWSLVVEGDGLFAAGTFNSIGGQPRNRLAKLSLGGGGEADASWNPAPNGIVDLIAGDGQGAIFAVGPFSSIGGLTRGRLVKLSASGTGAADAVWNPAPDGGGVRALVADGSGNLFVGGPFTSIGGQPVSRLAKLSTSGTGPADANWNPAPDGAPNALALGPSNALFVAGEFTRMAGLSYRGLGKLDAGGTGVPYAGWAPLAWDVSRLAVLNQAVYVGGYFGTIGNMPRSALAALPHNSADQIFDDGFEP